MSLSFIHFEKYLIIKFTNGLSVRPPAVSLLFLFEIINLSNFCYVQLWENSWKNFTVNSFTEDNWDFSNGIFLAKTPFFHPFFYKS